MVSSKLAGAVILVWNVEKRLSLHLNYYVIFIRTLVFGLLCATFVESHFLNLLTLKLTSKILTQKVVLKYLSQRLNRCHRTLWYQPTLSLATPQDLETMILATLSSLKALLVPSSATFAGNRMQNQKF